MRATDKEGQHKGFAAVAEIMEILEEIQGQHRMEVGLQRRQAMLLMKMKLRCWRELMKKVTQNFHKNVCTWKLAQ